MVQIPVRLIRFLSFDGKNVQFTDNSNPLAKETLPLAPACRGVASQLKPRQLCKATILDDVIIQLDPTRKLVP